MEIAPVQTPTTEVDIHEVITWDEKRKEMFLRVRSWSENFINQTAHPDGAFHSYRHFENVVKAGRKYLEKVNGSTRGVDPLNFWDDLQTYCQDKGLNKNFFSPQDLEIAIDLFGMSHDLGNMFKSLKDKDKPIFNIDKKGRVAFSKDGAENRSVTMLDTFANQYLTDTDISPEKKIQIISLVKTWIRQTDIKQTDQSKTFNKFAQGIDQLGQAIVDDDPSTYTQTQYYLLNEELYDREGLRFLSDTLTSEQLLFRLANFAQNTLIRLTNNDTEQKQLLNIFADSDILPTHLIYEPDDERLEILKSHLLYRIKERFSKQLRADEEYEEQGVLLNIARGAVHEAIAEMLIPEDKNLLPIQNEISDILQSPKKYGFKRYQFERIGDVVKVKLSKNGYIVIENVYEAKSSGMIDERGKEQINGGIETSMKNLCEIINAMDADKLREIGLSELAIIKEGLPESNLTLAIQIGFKVILVLPKDESVSGIKVEVVNTNYTKDQVTRIADVFLENFPIPQTPKPPTSSPRR